MAGNHFLTHPFILQFYLIIHGVSISSSPYAFQYVSFVSANGFDVKNLFKNDNML